MDDRVKSNQQNSPPKLLARCGLIADIQYLDIEDDSEYALRRGRRYKGTLKSLESAIKWWNEFEQMDKILQLGDLIDGHAKDLNQTEMAYNTLMGIFSNSKCSSQDIIHVIGNHELYNFSRQELASKLKTHRGQNQTSYYSIRVENNENVKILVLDAYDISVMNPHNKEEAYQLLEKYNPNDIRNNGVGNPDWKAGLRGQNRRYMPYNGAIGPAQLEWIENELRESEKDKDIVVCLSHVPFHDQPTKSLFARLWNAEDVLRIIRRFNCVKFCLYGHDHSTMHYLDKSGIHHITIPSPLHAEGDDQDCSAVVEIYKDHARIVGKGTSLPQYGEYRFKES